VILIFKCDLPSLPQKSIQSVGIRFFPTVVYFGMYYLLSLYRPLFLFGNSDLALYASVNSSIVFAFGILVS
jgi:hypothetical protein